MRTMQYKLLEEVKNKFKNILKISIDLNKGFKNKHIPRMNRLTLILKLSSK